MSTYREHLTAKFSNEYNRLNDQQRVAVDNIDGPVMVIAGPGTGKTQILAARIGKILLETDTLPENILCLTYTDAGTIAMRNRLLYFIGPDAYKVNIYTFHAFCNEVIQENLSLFEKNSLDPISDLEKIELFKQLVDSFEKGNVLKRYRGDVYYEVKNLEALFSTMKREGWTSQYINEKIDEYINDLPQRDEYIAKRATKTYKKGDVREDKIEEEKEKMEKLRAAVNEFDRFQKMMRDKNRYDFNDMINWVIEAFEKNVQLLLRYQEQFQYILVDEYQDTSGTQNKLVALLISYWNDSPNVFVVGDDDQSIYRFQGANVENMLDFADKYTKNLLTVVLTQNYRSTQPILDVSKTLIDHNNDRLVKKMPGLDKNLIAANAAINKLTAPPVIKEYETPRQEMTGIVLQVEQLIAANVAPGNISVIYRENKYGDELAQYFKLCNIPVYRKRSINIFEIPIAQKIIMLLEYLDAEHDIPFSGDELLFEILHFDWLQVPAMEIAKISTDVASRQFGETKTSIRQLICEITNAPAKDLFTPTSSDGLKKASVVLEKLISDVSNVTLQNLFESIIRETGLLNYIINSNEKIWYLQVLDALFDFVKEETKRNPSLTIHQLITTIDLMKSEGITLPLVEVSGSDKGVNLLTAHGSKGLEFEYVFFAGCNAIYWEKKKSPGKGYSMPDTMFTSLAKHEVEEELRRLFYVVLTRAEQHLEVSYSRFKSDAREIEPSKFIAEIQEVHELPVEKTYITPEAQSRFSVLQYATSGLQPEIEKAEKNFIDRLLEKFVMNVTALNNYLRCPLVFYYRNLIRVPSGRNEAAEFGSGIHFALERLFKKMQDSGTERFPSKEEFINDFEKYLHRHRENFTREQFTRRMEYGREVLANYYESYIYQWTKVVSIERFVNNVVIQGVPIKGKLDKLEFSGYNVNVVDYKTGDPERAKDKLKPPSDRDPQGGDYWRQGVFYKILIDNDGSNKWTVVSTEFDFIEPDKKKLYRREKLVIQPQDITTVTQQIKTVWNKIQEHDFYQGCGKEDCYWCNFAKTNNLAVALHEAGEEEE